MNPTILSRLSCPVCKQAMTLDPDGRVCKCLAARAHCYDRAKSGYFNFTSPSDGSGDLKEAVNARREFLGAGYYQPLSDAVNDLLSEVNAETVVDAGCGEGYYTNRMAQTRDVLGVDLSRAGIDAAAKGARRDATRATFLVSSLFTLPVQDATFDAVTNLFAPCAEEEFSRVLRAGGHLLLVGAGERHLMGLKKVLYDDPYLNQGRADLPQDMELLVKKRLSYSITVKGCAHVEALFSMTPYYWRTGKEAKDKLLTLDTLETEVDFDLYLFRKGR